MARPLRIQYPGALYHVMARGNQGQAVFPDESDRVRFLETLGEAGEKTGWQIHAYVLMGNHYHLLVETPEANLVDGMKWLQGAYTLRHNRRHQVRGHLFQGRYLSIVIDSDEADYLSTASTYIHLNPARAGWISVGKEGLKSYPWSSYPFYIGRSQERPAWLRTERVLGSLGFGPKETKGYEAYIEGRVLEWGSQDGRKDLEKQWKTLRRGWYLGDQDFKEQLQAGLATLTCGLRRESHSGAAKVAHDEAAAETELGRAMQALRCTPEQLSKMPKMTPEKAALAWWLRRRTTASLRWVTERLEMGHYSRVTQAVYRTEHLPGRKLGPLKRRLQRLAETVGN
jgi:putative transposase